MTAWEPFQQRRETRNTNTKWTKPELLGFSCPPPPLLPRIRPAQKNAATPHPPTLTRLSSFCCYDDDPRDMTEHTTLNITPSLSISLQPDPPRAPKTTPLHRMHPHSPASPASAAPTSTCETCPPPSSGYSPRPHQRLQYWSRSVPASSRGGR